MIFHFAIAIATCATSRRHASEFSDRERYPSRVRVNLRTRIWVFTQQLAEVVSAEEIRFGLYGMEVQWQFAGLESMP
jgi:hypothetical protein